MGDQAVKEELRFLAGLRQELGVTMSSSQEGKGLVHVDVDTVGENTYTYTHTQQGLGATAAAFQDCVKSGGKFPALHLNILKELSYCRSHIQVLVRWHSSVALPACVCAFFCVTEDEWGGSPNERGCF